MNVGPFSNLIAQLEPNWRMNAPQFVVSINEHELEVEENHPLYCELVSLCSGRSASLPFFAKENEVVWCTIAPDSETLREAVASLQAWVLPSFGGERSGDGYVQPDSATGALAAAIISLSPSGYYKWRCPRNVMDRVCEKLRLRHSLEALRPARTRPPRPSLYELRARFSAALFVGDRDGAEKIIELLDFLQLETAVNTQFMRIRLWHHFREHDRIRTHPDLPHLLAQPLPPRVRAWIDEALENKPSGTPFELPTPVPMVTEEASAAPSYSTWVDWFNHLRKGDRDAAELFLAEHCRQTPDDLKPAEIKTLVTSLDELFLDDTLRDRERDLITPGIADFLEEIVRESEFPRTGFGDIYLALLRLWSTLHAGNSSGQQNGHILLELASAALKLNRAPGEVLKMIEHWWEVRPSCSQLPFALDAIELLEREYPNPDAPANLWLAAADLILRNPEALVPSEKKLWRRVAKRLGIDETTVGQYLPPESEEADQTDLLAEARLRHIAIICMREPQAREAATQIVQRTGAKVTLVTGQAASSETDYASTADVILFVWMATSHAVFRAFDETERKHLCYVQGTGAASIVRSLERWVGQAALVSK